MNFIDEIEEHILTTYNKKLRVVPSEKGFSITEPGNEEIEEHINKYFNYAI